MESCGYVNSAVGKIGYWWEMADTWNPQLARLGTDGKWQIVEIRSWQNWIQMENYRCFKSAVNKTAVGEALLYFETAEDKISSLYFPFRAL
jgi:hypothetical protein